MGFPSIHKFDHKIAVYYKFMGATDYTRIAIDGPPVSVGFFIAMILEFKNLGTCEEIDFAVSNAETNEEYQDESMLLENNTYVVIRLVSRSPPITATTAQEPIIENKVANIHVADLSGEAFELSERRSFPNMHDDYEKEAFELSERRFFPNMQDDYETYSEFPRSDSNFQRGSMQRRLDFDVPQMLKNDIVGDQQTACDNKVVSSWRCVVPSNSLHLNASTTPIYSQESIQETVIEEAPQAVKVNPGSVKKKMGMSLKRCKCKNSLCLKLYCECFAAGYYCLNSAEPCLCVDCFNKPSHEDTVAAVRNKIEKRNPLAFAPKVISSADSVMEAIYDASKTPPSARHKRGCNCKKSNCLQNYCECFQGSVGCSSQCRCKACMKHLWAQK